MALYTGLCRAQLSYDYLHTNSTTHEFLFGALAELVDNARDASATKIDIYSSPDENLRGEFMLCFLDDGEGMSADEASDIITFGKSAKRTVDSQLIGMYGNGLKSGSMRIGNDFILFTKKGASMTCVFLSRTFHEEEKIDEIIVPMPAFETTTRKPMAKTAKEKEKHNTEMSLILKYSPFKTEAAFMKEFDRIEGNSGTLVVVYNLKLLDSGETELDIKTDITDILLTNPDSSDYNSDEGEKSEVGISNDRSLMPERRSFRAYTSVLYVDPRMRIYIQHKKIQTKRLVHQLYKPRMYRYSSSRFKTRSEKEAKKSEEEAKGAENRAREAESKARNLENKYGTGGTKEQRAELRKVQAAALDARKEAQVKKQMAERKTKALRDPKTLNFIYGININNRSQDGMFVYNCSRLIKMYQKVGPQTDGGTFCSGVVGIVDVPYLVLEPTHNKQDFADAKEYRHLQKAMGEHMVQYWKDVNIAAQGVSKFWENFGYLSPNWKDQASEDPKFVRKRAMQLQTTIQCDLCLKWRVLPFATSNIGKTFPDNWVCSMNVDPSHNRCSTAEQKLNITEGVLKKEVKSAEQKQEELEKEIQKKQEQLNKMQKTKVVTSSRQLRDIKKEDSEDDDVEEEEEEGSEDDEEGVKPVRKDSKTYGRSLSESQRKPATLTQRSTTPVRSSRAQVSYSQQASSSTSRLSFSSSKSKSKGPSIRRPPKRSVSTSEDEVNEADDDDEDDEDEAPPPKRQAATPSKTPVKKAAAMPSTEKKSDSPPPATPKRDSSDIEMKVEKKTPIKQIHRKPILSMGSDSENESTQMDTTEPDDGISVAMVNGEVGARVEAKIQSTWYAGVVTMWNKSAGKWKIKFDNRDKGEKWFDVNGADVRVIKANNGEVPATVSQSPASASETTNEIPSSSTAAGAAHISQMTEEIGSGYRTCLRYFLPPQWVMDKEAVSQLSTEALATFPLDDFFDHYEKGLRKLVSSFQTEAQAKQVEAEQAKQKLTHVRKLIAKLLKSINEEFDIDPECDSEQVDELLAACVRQAMQDSNET